MIMAGWVSGGQIHLRGQIITCSYTFHAYPITKDHEWVIGGVWVFFSVQNGCSISYFADAYANVAGLLIHQLSCFGNGSL